MHSLRTKILTITLVFSAFAAVAFVLYSMATTVNYKRLRLDSIEKTVELETEKANKVIEGLERSAISLATDGLLFFDSQSYTIGEESVLEYLHSFPTATGGGLWFEPYAFNKNALRACIYAYVDKSSGEIRLDEIDLNTYNYHDMAWYQEIIGEITKPYEVKWAKPYTDDTSSALMTTAGAGIFDKGGKLIGVSIIDWEIENVVKELTAIKPTNNSFVLLCVPERDYIISSTRTNSIVGASIKSLPWDISADSFTLNSVKYLRFGRYMDNNWLLSIQIPEKEIFAEVENRNNRYSILIAFSSLAMLSLAYYLVSKLINKPIKRLTSDVAQLALGNLDVKIKINSNDELGLLAQTFNKMTSDLKESVEAYAQERAEKERIGTELSVAAEIQSSMLPRNFPPFPSRSEFNIYASMVPAKEVGGDFYDFFLIDNNTLAITIADVSGKGVPAALFMVITKILIKTNACSGKSPADVFETVNNTLCENNDKGMFVTAFMGYFNTSSGNFVYINAGHTPPFLKKAGENYENIKTDPCLVLGCTKNNIYKEVETTLNPGDSLFFFTDGVTEAMNSSREIFTDVRLGTALNANKDLHPKELLSAIKKEIDNFAGGAEQSDDITMLALEVGNLAEVKAETEIAELETID